MKPRCAGKRFAYDRKCPFFRCALSGPAHDPGFELTASGKDVAVFFRTMLRTIFGILYRLYSSCKSDTEDGMKREVSGMPVQPDERIHETDPSGNGMTHARVSKRQYRMTLK